MVLQKIVSNIKNKNKNTKKYKQRKITSYFKPKISTPNTLQSSPLYLLSYSNKSNEPLNKRLSELVVPNKTRKKNSKKISIKSIERRLNKLRN